jgi:transcription termination/antitermination protein NusG
VRLLMNGKSRRVKQLSFHRKQSDPGVVKEDSMAEQIEGVGVGAGGTEQLGPPANEKFKWYIIHAYSGFERKVRESLEGRVQAFGLQNKIGRVMIPLESVTEVVNGKKRTVERVFLPGYVLVEMDLDNDLWHIIKNTPRVTGFLGTGDKPVALSEEEVSSILFRTDTSKEKPRLKIKFEKNESVRITDGPFANFNGVVDEVNEDRETVKVMVTIFGRSTPVELEFNQVEKVVT